MKQKEKYVFVLMSLIVILSVVLSACAPSPTPAPTQDVAAIQTQSAQTVVAEMTQSAPVPTLAPPPVETAAPTAPPPGPTPDPSVPVAVLPTPAAGEPTALANFNTTINSGPGTNYVVYGVFLGSATAKVIGKSEDGKWWAVSVPVAPDGSGWVDGAWVTTSNVEGVPVLPTPPVPPTTNLVPPAPSDPQGTVITNAYVRSGPGANYPAYGIASAGRTARIIGVSEDRQWWAVRINPELVGAGYGWIQASYLQTQNVEAVPTIASPQASQPVPSTPPAEGTPTATSVDYVNVRSGPGSNYPVLGVAAPGATAEVSGKSADSAWWQIVIPQQYQGGGYGWVSASYVVTKNTENTPVVEAPPAPPVVEPTPPATTGTGCELVGQTPADGTVFNPGQSFTTTWVLKNTGSDKWTVGEYDIGYVGAYQNVVLHQGADLYDLASNVDPGYTYYFYVPMIAPYDPGPYGELWQITKSNQVICQFWVYIQTK
jgi:uncharacterized protein YraI